MRRSKENLELVDWDPQLVDKAGSAVNGLTAVWQ